jgi:GT2 family glycosyltransferase
MNSVGPVVSVIVPSHNRCASLRLLLEALGTQTYPRSLMEVVVVADGCHDRTAHMLGEYQAPFCLRSEELPGLGPGVARNRGAAEAAGALLLFIDDDARPSPGLIEAHVRVHLEEGCHVAIGYLCWPAGDHGNLFRIGLRSWWESQFRAMRQPGHRFTYRDLLSGNFSISAALFRGLGGFDGSLPRREDYEFGLRLVQADLTFAFVPAAVGYHYDETDARGSLQRIYYEGRGDVLIGRRHPELRPNLPVFHFRAPRGLFQHSVHALAFDAPRIGEALALALARALRLAEGLRLRGVWRRLFIGLRHYWYLRGVAQELRSRKALSSFLQGGPARADQPGGEMEMEIDLAGGLLAAERRLERDRPAGIRLCYGQQVVGRVPAQTGAERLRGAHLRPLLATTLADQLLRALIVEQVTYPQHDERPASPA